MKFIYLILYFTLVYGQDNKTVDNTTNSTTTLPSNVPATPQLLTVTPFLNTTISLSLNKNKIEDLSLKDDGDKVFDMVSKELKDKVKIFCVILTAPKYKYTRVIPQLNTWLKKGCNDWMYASSQDDPSIKAVKVINVEGYKYSYGKIKNGLIKAYQMHGDKFDYYMKVDDDTFVIAENLRMFLLNKNPNKIEWFGHIYSYMHKKTRIQFYQGGAGYVMSKALVKLLVNKGFPKLCRKAPDEFDDREIGMCLNKMMKIYTHETRDLNRKLVFVPGNPEQFATMGPNKKASWYHFNNLVKYPKGKNSLSDYPISFHYVSTDMFYALEYLIYHSNVVGKRQLIFRDNQNENKTEAAAKIIKKMEDYSNKFYVTVEK